MKFKMFEWGRDRRILKAVGLVVVLVAGLIIIKDEMVWQFGDYEDYSDDYYDEEYYGDDVCNVAKIDLKGFMDIEFYEDGDVGSSEIVAALEEADNDENIQAIILDIDSNGGVPVAGEEISNALSRAYKPTVALIRGIGLSAAYWAATGADMIFASANSDIGSIGVTISYLDNVKQNQMEGLNYNQLSTGKYKDMFSSDKPLTYAEKLLIERDLKITYKNFVETVAEKRELQIEAVEKMADGSSMMGEMALENGLIDQIGDLYVVKQYLSDEIGEEVVVCW